MLKQKKLRIYLINKKCWYNIFGLKIKTSIVVKIKLSVSSKILQQIHYLSLSQNFLSRLFFEVCEFNMLNHYKIHTCLNVFYL